MISSQPAIVLERTVQRVARLSHDRRETTVTVQATPHYFVISAGLQGPVGTVAEDVLARAAAAEQAAGDAAVVAGQAVLDLNQLITGLNNAFAYHAGAISAQGG